MAGLASANDVAEGIKPKLKLFASLSVLYDFPRMYLNVNLFGSLCSCYDNLIVPTATVLSKKYLSSPI